MVKNLPANAGDIRDFEFQFLGQEDPLEKNMTTLSSITWKIPWPEEPGRLQSIGLQRVEYDWSDLACM